MRTISSAQIEQFIKSPQGDKWANNPLFGGIGISETEIKKNQVLWDHSAHLTNALVDCATEQELHQSLYKAWQHWVLRHAQYDRKPQSFFSRFSLLTLLAMLNQGISKKWTSLCASPQVKFRSLFLSFFNKLRHRK
jgi:hypothetical protein